VSKQICALCREERKLCKSHIIPEFLYTQLYDDKHRVAVLGKDFDRMKYEQKGLREHLLCISCESYLSKYEKYASRLLKGEEGKRRRQSARLYSIEDVDYQLFRLFGLSLLWRASIASGEFFQKVRLGPHQESIRQMILSGDPGRLDTYGFFLGRVLSSELQPDALMMQPTISRFEGHRCYRFVFGGFVWVFVVSSHGLSEVARACLVSEEGKMLIVEHELEDIKFMMRGITAIGRRMAKESYRHD
jgi:hypothetical protein